MKIEYNVKKLSNVFYRMTYDQFQLSPAYKQGFSKEEIEWALYEANYRYFGSYEFTDQQSMAMDILEWAAKEYLKSD